ncbi:hypothetical protein N0V82_008903 [Gnomoniopsis sp. IMI 355080]|nr:hypothetical protein N0V82_008903 [Gnomoniopsis sp. IMI 355080]
MTTVTHEQTTKDKIPILLLKTKSTPGDAYQDTFAQSQCGLCFDPFFVPVLEHTFDKKGMTNVDSILKSKQIGDHPDSSYGGLVFTSQRAVEAFTKLVQDGQGETYLALALLLFSPFLPSLLTRNAEHQKAEWPYLQNVPVYSVGPATTRALTAVPQDPPLRVFGEHTGNGDSLAHFILDHYGTWYDERNVKPSLLFLVGEQRRDIIPKTLMDKQLPQNRRIQVDEIVVYGTEVMDSFPQDFKLCLDTIRENRMTWIVVFSPTGCDAMLKGLGMLDETTGKARPKDPARTRFVATIGPTTRNYLQRTFQFEPDVCAEKPSPEGVLEGIKQFVSQL